ncbi:MAG: biotin-independent malonate decarboxylase subunit gamma [Vicinamibacteraceae bacterium]
MAERAWSAIVDQLCRDGHQIEANGAFLSGTATVDGTVISVIGTTRHAVIDPEMALRMAGAILSVIRDAPRRPILILVDTNGQSLRRRDELLGISSYMAHLAKCIEMARRRGHRVVSLVYDQAVSGGFLATGMMADLCFALPQAEVHVMNLRAMAQVTKISREQLERLSCSSPVFARGAENYFNMGAIDAIWDGDIGSHLAAALRQVSGPDDRASHGLTRGGRHLAGPVAWKVRRDDGAGTTTETRDGED